MYWLIIINLGKQNNIIFTHIIIDDYLSTCQVPTAFQSS